MSLPPADIGAEITGTNEILDGVPVLTELHVHYRLRIPAGSRDAVDRALASHQDKCPSARSFRDSVRIHWTADIEEAD